MNGSGCVFVSFFEEDMIRLMHSANNQNKPFDTMFKMHVMMKSHSAQHECVKCNAPVTFSRSTVYLMKPNKMKKALSADVIG